MGVAVAVLTVAAAANARTDAQPTGADLSQGTTLIATRYKALTSKWRPRSTTTTTAKPPPTTTTAKPPPTTTTAAPTTTTAAPTTTTPPGAPTSLFADGFEGGALALPWLDDARMGSWTSIYNGYGLNTVELDGSKVLSQSPMVSTNANETHGSLAVTSSSYGDFDATVRVKTLAQLRIGSNPNPWEVAWVLWSYTDDTHFYSFTPKPNGWELGKEDPAYPGAQRYLRTGSTPTFPIGRWYTVRIRQVGTTITVWVDGAQITSFTDAERPYSSGQFGLYNEDAHVHFDDVAITTP